MKMNAPSILLLAVLCGPALSDTLPIVSERAMAEGATLERVATDSPESRTIVRRVNQFFVMPPRTPKGLTATVELLVSGSRVVPNSVTITRSSGDAVFDVALINATYRASPFRLPAESQGGMGPNHAPVRLAFRYDG